MHGDTSVGKLHDTSFWKNLVSTDPAPQLDENGEAIPGSGLKSDAERAISNFAMIKKMMRLK